MMNPELFSRRFKRKIEIKTIFGVMPQTARWGKKLCWNKTKR
jgi:hypothetical protein